MTTTTTATTTPTPTKRLALLLLATAALAAHPTRADVEEQPDPDHVWRKAPTVALVARDNDPRLPATRAAIAYWNRTLAALGSPLRLSTVVRSPRPVPARFLETADVFTLGESDAAPFPPAVWDQPGELVVVLSDGDFISFTAGLPARGKVLVAIKSERLAPLDQPNVLQNVIAHELGHALGLHHNADPATLMCGRPADCRPDVFASQTPRFFPLTADEKRLLLAMYPAAAKTPAAP